MVSLQTFVSEPEPCSYLPQEQARIEYEIVSDLKPEEYAERMDQGWRRFGYALFRPVCRLCRKCQSLRVPVDSFRPDRSQKRAFSANAETQLVIGKPKPTREKLAIYDRFHTFQSSHRGWREHSEKDPEDYISSFVENPIATDEWCYYLSGKLVGVGYVDRVPHALSAIYFYYDPEERDRSLGTFNILSTINLAQSLQLPYVYLGYYVEGCRSLEYKARFRPNELLIENAWQSFRT